jgi:hypothetical protein
MPIYVKAYYLKQMRAYPEWREQKSDPSATADLTNDTVVYLHADLRVTRDAFGETGLLFRSAAESWSTFCTETLGFREPNWDAEAREVKAAVRKAEATESANGSSI